MRLFKQHPNDSPQDGTIHPIALTQLAVYRSRALLWDYYTDGRANRCYECHQNIWFSQDASGFDYVITDEQIIALTVAHIRQAHDS